eukprot:TRINITY_DN14890_c0_g1_i2.p1 TRINITY_DN14890_c0_g1~~TRINITY_DN14890_c0_g1_i2.p1  ORF type:complete len:101 (+),score=10.39 TRINITY_DN14890_c0_g1_i2:35-304(+)
MWWEILPSFSIIVGVYAAKDHAISLFHRAINNGNPHFRSYEFDHNEVGTSYWRRDTQKSEKSFWMQYIRPSRQGPGSVYRTHGLEALED